MTTRETELLAANAALEAEVMRLRNALEQIKLRSISLADAQVVALEAVSTPSNTTALPELIEKVEKLTLERCAGECKTLGLYGITCVIHHDVV